MEKEILNSLLEQTASAKGISSENVKEALEEAVKKSYIHYLGGGDDADVSCVIDPETGHILIANSKMVVATDDDIEDDYLQISLEAAKEDVDALIARLKELYKECKPRQKTEKEEIQFLLEKVKEAGKNIEVGKNYPHYVLSDEIGNFLASAIKNNFRSKLSEYEKTALYEIYKDHIGEMMTGTVERADDRSISVNIGRATVELTRKELIGDELFRVGDPIKVYIQEVKGANDNKGKGPQIEATRASEGFLKRLFEEEIHEIYDGTVLIRGIAREAGVRSKVAVSSTIADVDPTGSCIGPGGTRIQKIVSQLGTGKDKEKIDIIAYHDSTPLFIADSLRPAQVVGVSMEDDEDGRGRPIAIAVVTEEQYSVAIGRKGANARLADRLTGYHIDIMTEKEAMEDGIEFVPYDVMAREVEEQKKQKARVAFAEKSKADLASHNETSYDDISIETSDEEEEDIALPSFDDSLLVIEENEPEEEKKEEASVEEKKEEAVKPEPVKAEPVHEEPTKEVKVKTTLEDLEKELAESVKKGGSRPGKPASKSKRPRKIEEDEVAPASSKEVAPAAGVMPIYSDEELEEIEAEEALLDNSDFEDSDLEDYDDYYDEDNR